MGKVYISAIEAGVDTDEVTARASDVLTGKTTIDDEGEVVNGTMPDNSTRTSNGNMPALSTADLHRPTRPADYFVASIDTDGNKVFNICPPKGYYPGNDTNNLGQSFVNVPISTFGTARQNQVLNGISFTSENGFRISGTIPRIANDTQSPLHGPASSSHYRVHLPSNGYYENNDNRPYVLVNLEQICNNLGVDTSKMLDTLQIGTRRGTVAARGDVQDTSWVWLDSSIGRVIVSFPEGYYRRSNENNAPRIRIPLETVLKSLGIGPKVAFNGATFDGTLISGVANLNNRQKLHGIRVTNTDLNLAFGSLNSENNHNNEFGHYLGKTYKLDGINNGGLQVSIRNSNYRETYWSDIRLLAGYVMKESIDIKHFSRIRVGYKIIDAYCYSLSDNDDNYTDALVRVGILLTSIHGGGNNSLYGAEFKLYENQGATSVREHRFNRINRTISDMNVQQYLEIDVSAWSGQQYLGIGAGVERGEHTRSTIVFNHIEFI